MLYKNALLVKIVNVTSNLYWYRDEIGQEYWVVKEIMPQNECFKYKVIYPVDCNNDNKWLIYDDIEIIKTSDIEVTETVTHTLTEYPKNKLYIVVGGTPFRTYIGTTSFTSIKELCRTINQSEANNVVKDMYEECCGLIYIIEVDLENELQNRNR